MAKIGDLVKTYRLLSDPNAPDWNVKFVGALALGVVLVAAAVGGLYWARGGDAPSATSAPAAEGPAEPPAPEDECAVPPSRTLPTVVAPGACPPPPLLP